MFLKSIRIQDVRCIQDVEISFATETRENRKWTIIVGENGGGKSTILKAIAFLLAGSDAWAELFENADDWIRNGADESTISGVLTTSRGEERPISVTIEREDTLRTLYARNEESMSLLDRALRHTERSYFTAGYGVSRRLSERLLGGIADQAYRSPRALAVTTLFSPETPLISFESWAMTLHDQRSKDAIKLVHRTMNGLLPGLSFHGIDVHKRRLMFDTPDGLVPLRELSEGYRNVIGWIGDLLTKLTNVFGDYKSPLEARGLLLIDELDLHMHPSWQRRVVHFLMEKLPQLQLIVTTNSPLLAHQSHENELHYLRRSAEHGPQIHQFEGLPHKLLLQQLIVSPVFGVDTANSYVIQQHRAEFATLSDKKKLSTTEKRRLKYVRDSLADATQWNEVTEQGQHMADLLSRIEQKLK